MIPEELHLRNFLSHRETDLDLRGVHLASLVGENGAGKSSLLDAITWVAWGRSRAPYGHDDDLIYHGATDLEVEYTFRMPYQGGAERRFRVLRRKELRGRRSTTSVLDFQVQGEDGWLSLNGNTIRETQARIIQQLGLEYDTFVNSAYLRQGHADEFTVQTPAQRKRVLGAILGLDRWAEYQDRVKRRLSKTEGQLEELERRVEQIEGELARRPQHETELEAAEAEAAQAGALLREIQEQLNELTRVKEQAMGLRRNLEELEARWATESARLASMEEEADEHRRRRDTYRERIANADEIRERYARYQATLEEERSWSDKLSQAARLQEEKSRLEGRVAEVADALRGEVREREQQVAALEGAIAEVRGRLEGELGDLRGQIRLLEERVPGEELIAELEEAEGRLAFYGGMEEELELARADLGELEVERSRLLERNRQLKGEMEETKTRLDALAEAEAACPMCRQPLTSEHHERLLEQIETEGKTMGDEYRANVERLGESKEEASALQDQIRAHERTLRERSRTEQVVARLRQKREQGEEARKRLAELAEEVAALEGRLKGEDYAPEEREARAELAEEVAALEERLDSGAYAEETRGELAGVLAELAELGYDAEAHEGVKARVRELAPAEEAYRELEKAHVGVQGEEEALKRLARELKTQEARIAEVAGRREARQAELDELLPKLEKSPRVVEALQEARQREANARHRVGAARQTLAALDTQEGRLKRLAKERAGLVDRVTLLKELRDAFGVNGIPAMIIEHTLPELEREANRILEQLTGGRMHVRFDTQRETKSGTVRETLDIIISDEKGTRPYENFSGGEQFRVNFAIRVALSRLLAQRSGVRLRSLFVDEGFGTLDEDGRRRLVESVKAVQTDFDLVLVITHIAELRDAFPVRVQVTKTEMGSQVEVI
jgi:exonuclease SbcC